MARSKEGPNESRVYKVIALSDYDAGSLESKLNELGSEGWEVVAYVGHEQLDSIVLKCQKQVEVDEDSEAAPIY